MLLVVCGMESLKNQAVYWNGSYKSEMTTAYVHPYSSQIDDTYLYYLPNLELRTNKPPNQTRSRVFLVTRKLSKKKQCPNRDAYACLEAASFCCRCCCRIWDLQPISVTQRSKTLCFFSQFVSKASANSEKDSNIYIYILIPAFTYIYMSQATHCYGGIFFLHLHVYLLKNTCFMWDPWDLYHLGVVTGSISWLIWYGKGFSFRASPVIAVRESRHSEAFGIWQIMGWPTLRLASVIDTLCKSNGKSLWKMAGWETILSF